MGHYGDNQDQDDGDGGHGQDLQYREPGGAGGELPGVSGLGELL